MDQETITKILFVIQALNNTYVSGKQNLVNLSVSIDTLEGIARSAKQEQDK